MAVFPALAAVLAAALAGRTASRAARGRSPAMWCWTIALVQFALASGCLAWAAAAGWTTGIFRAYYLFGAVSNVVWLALGTVWLLSPPEIGRVVTGAVAALTAYAAWRCTGPLLEGSRLIASLPAGDFPDTASIIPGSLRGLARWSSIAGSVVVLGGLGWSLRRNRVKVRGLGLLMAGVLMAAVASEFARAAMPGPFGAGLALAVALMYAGFEASGRPVGAPVPVRADLTVRPDPAAPGRR